MKLERNNKLTYILAFLIALVFFSAAENAAQPTLSLWQSDIMTMVTYQQDTTPALDLLHPQGAVRAGKLWIDISGVVWFWKRRNFANTAQSAFPQVSSTVSHFNNAVGGVFVAKTLNDLYDVNAAGASTGQVLKFDGAKWTPGTDLNDDGAAVQTVVTSVSELDKAIAMANAAPATNFTIALNGTINLAGVSKIVPRNLRLQFFNNAKFVETIEGAALIIYDLEAPRAQIFSGFEEGDLSLRGSYETVFPEWFGAKGDAVLDVNGNYVSGADDYAAIQLMFRSVRANNTGTGIETSGRFSFGQKVYYSGNTISVANSIHIMGTGGAAEFSGSVIKFAANKTGFVFQGGTTERGGTNGTTMAGSATFKTATSFFTSADVGSQILIRDGVAQGSILRATIAAYVSPTQVTLSAPAGQSINGAAWYAFSSARGAYNSLIERIKIIGSTGYVNPAGGAGGGYNGIATHTGDLNTSFSTTFGIPNYPSIYFNDTLATDEDFIYEEGYTRGMTVTIGKSSFIVDQENAAYLPQTATRIKLLPLRFATPGLLSSGSVVAGDYAPNVENWWIGGTLKFPGDTTNYTITGISGGFQISPSKSGTYAGDVEFIPPTRTGIKVRFNRYHGIEARGRIIVEDLGIIGFAGNGISVNSNLSPTGYFQTEPNNNYAQFRGNRIVSVSGHGVYTFGKNSNAMVLTANDVSSAEGYGFYDVSDLGSTYMGNHAASNRHGHYYSANGGVNRSNFFGNYGETQSPASFIGQYGLWLGGNNASGFQPSEGAIIDSYQYENGAPTLSIKSSVVVSHDVYVNTASKGIVLKSPDGSCYRFTVANGGALNAGVGVSCPTVP